MRRTPQQPDRDMYAVIIGMVLMLLVGIYFFARGYLIDRKQSATERSATTLSDPSATDTSTILTPDVLQQKIRNGESLILVDIRPQDAYAREHIPHSLSSSAAALTTFAPEKDQSLIVIDSSSDSVLREAANNILNQKSFPHFFLKGGFEEWKASGNQTVSSGDPNSFVDQSKLIFITGNELKSLLERKDTASPYLLDIQSPENFKKIHARGAINIPLDQLEKRIAEIPPAHLIVVYGENERISFQGGVLLFDLNIFSAKTLTGYQRLGDIDGLPIEP